MENITSIFREKKLKLTPQRLAVYKYLMSTNEHPSADRQHLRNLIRAAQKEKEQNKPSKAYREIYQILKTLILED